MVVAVTRTGNVFFVGEKVALEQLDVKIQQAVNAGIGKERLHQRGRTGKVWPGT